jgi:hypothetical protein
MFGVDHDDDNEICKTFIHSIESFPSRCLHFDFVLFGYLYAIRFRYATSTKLINILTSSPHPDFD